MMVTGGSFSEGPLCRGAVAIFAVLAFVSVHYATAELVGRALRAWRGFNPSFSVIVGWDARPERLRSPFAVQPGWASAQRQIRRDNPTRWSSDLTFSVPSQISALIERYKIDHVFIACR